MRWWRILNRDAVMALHLLTTMDMWASQLRCWSRSTPNTLIVDDGVIVEPEMLISNFSACLREA